MTEGEEFDGLFDARPRKGARLVAVRGFARRSRPDSGKEIRLRLLLLADVHLGARLPGWGDEARSRRDGLRRVWREAVDLALAEEEGVDAVLVAGDLFDRPEPDPDDAASVVEGAERLVAAGRTVVFLPGVYDGLSHSRAFYLSGRLPAGATVVTWETTQRVEVVLGPERLNLYAFAWVPGRTPADPFAGLRRGDGEGRHVGLFSARWETSEPPQPPLFWGRPVFPRAAAETCGLDLVVLGGDHAPRQETAGKTTVVQPGSPTALRRMETGGPRGFVIAELDEQGVRLQRRRSEASPVEPEAETVWDPEALLDRLADSGDGIRRRFAERILDLERRTPNERERAVLRRALNLGLRAMHNREATLAD